MCRPEPVRYADLIGAPFLEKGRGPNGYDCYGVYLEVNRRLGKEVPDLSSVAIAQTELIVRKITEARRLFGKITDAARPGDLVLIRNRPDQARHIGVAVCRCFFLEVCDRIGIHRSRLDDPTWSQLIEGVYRYAG